MLQSMFPFDWANADAKSVFSLFTTLVFILLAGFVACALFAEFYNLVHGNVMVMLFVLASFAGCATVTTK